MLLINLAISLFNVLKVNSLECLSLINQKCMPRPKILFIIRYWRSFILSV